MNDPIKVSGPETTDRPSTAVTLPPGSFDSAVLADSLDQLHDQPDEDMPKGITREAVGAAVAATHNETPIPAGSLGVPEGYILTAVEADLGKSTDAVSRLAVFPARSVRDLFL